MGCLTVTISNRTGRGIDVDATPRNCTPEVTVIPVQKDFNVESENKNTIIIVKSENRNPEMEVLAGNRNTSMEIRVGLVCQVSLGTFRVFYVADGPFMVEEGYFKVLKS